MKLKGLAFSLIALGLAIGTRPMPGQTISYFRQFTTPDVDRATAVAADASGIYVVGNRPSPQGGPGKGGVRKYDPLGNELWTREFSVPAYVGRAAADATGVYLLGEIKTVWDVALDATGVYGLVANSNGAPGLTVRKWDARGNDLWTRELAALDVHRAFAAAPTGFYVLAAAGADGWATTLRKYDSGGNELWSRHLDASYDPFVWIAADAMGVYVVGIARSGDYGAFRGWPPFGSAPDA